MSQLKSYPEYKDSGVDWIGKTPVEWEITKLKNLTFLRQQNVSTKKLKEKDWYYYDIPTIQQTGIGRIEKGSNIESNKYMLRGNEILVSKLNPRKGTVVKVEKPSELSIICSTELIPIVPEKINSGYLYFVLKNPITADVFNSMVTSVTYSHQRISPKNIEDLYIPTPNLNIQRIIANYLNQKTSQIEDLISDKERLIELLEEKRQAVITETVTKGLDPDVKMKDSGIEWIGDIPEHWDITKLKRYMKVMNGREIEIEAEFSDSNAIDVFGSGGVFKKTNKSLYEGESVLFGRKGTIGKPMYINQSFWTVDTMYYTKFYEDAFPKWFYYILYIFPWGLHTTNTALPSLVGTEIENNSCIIPPYSEQQLIANYLDEKTSRIHETIYDIKTQIDKLKEYRESLIFEAVTGKIDVREI